MLHYKFFILHNTSYLYHNNSELCTIWAPHVPARRVIARTKGNAAIDKFVLYSSSSLLDLNKDMPNVYQYQEEYKFSIKPELIWDYLMMNKILIKLIPNSDLLNNPKLFIQYVKSLDNPSFEALSTLKIYLLDEYQISYSSLKQNLNTKESQMDLNRLIDNLLVKFL